ncbi:hypothetical protein IAT40_004886 [Kwoniella sp. CBS 6097]
MPAPLSKVEYPSVEERVRESAETWIRDLRNLYEHAKDRFGDVSWISEGNLERIWGHKAPKAFKEQYFSTAYPSFSVPPDASSPGLSTCLPLGTSSPSLNIYHQPETMHASAISICTFDTTRTANTPEERITYLIQGDTCELFQAQLEWLYTGEGFGNVVDRINRDHDSTAGAPQEDVSREQKSIASHRDKLGQDLTYMWRSKLYADVRIRLISDAAQSSRERDSPANLSDNLSMYDTFTSHRFILASRSPYFRSVLLNPSSFRAATDELSLPSAAFTPAALHFCLGYMYAGHLDFSHRSFDLTTAFQIHQAASYLQLDALVNEIEARIAQDFCHGLDWDLCRCRNCPPRAARVWRAVTTGGIHAERLEDRARTYIIDGWSESWAKDVACSNPIARGQLVQEVTSTFSPASMAATFRSIQRSRRRIEATVRSKGLTVAEWTHTVEDMIQAVENAAICFISTHLSEVIGSQAFVEMISANDFDSDLLELILDGLVEHLGTITGCSNAPQAYQILQGSLKPSSYQRPLIERAQQKLHQHMIKRWMQIRDSDGFRNIELELQKRIANVDSVDAAFGHQIGTTRTRKPSQFGSPSTSSGHATSSAGLRRLRLSSSASSKSALSLISSETLDTTVTSKAGRKTLKAHNWDEPKQSRSLTDSLGRISGLKLPTTASTPHGVSRLRDAPIERSIPAPQITGHQQAKRRSFATPNHRSKATAYSAELTAGDELLPKSPGHSKSQVGSTSAAIDVPGRVDSRSSSNMNQLPRAAAGPVPVQFRSRSTSTRRATDQLRASNEGITVRISKPSQVRERSAPINRDLIRRSPSLSARNPPAREFLGTPIPAVPGQHNTSDGIGSFKSYAASNHRQRLSRITPRIALNVGIPCIVSLVNQRARFSALIRFIGLMHNSSGPWIGVEVDDLHKIGVKTLSSGSKDGVTYFEISSDYDTPTTPTCSPSDQGDLTGGVYGTSHQPQVTTATSDTNVVRPGDTVQDRSSSKLEDGNRVDGATTDTQPRSTGMVSDVSVSSDRSTIPVVVPSSGSVVGEGGLITEAQDVNSRMTDVNRNLKPRDNDSTRNRLLSSKSTAVSDTNNTAGHRPKSSPRSRSRSRSPAARSNSPSALPSPNPGGSGNQLSGSSGSGSGSGNGRKRALFVRPSEIVFVMGGEM